MRRKAQAANNNTTANEPENPLTSLPKIDLNNNNLVSLRYFPGLINGLSQLSNLKELHLDENSINEAGCRALVPLLQKKAYPLKILSLKQNQINDNCISILVNALQTNNVLETLDLYNNEGITDNGWDCILNNLLCNKTSITSTYTSNHSLQSLGESPPPFESPEPARVKEMLTINKSPGKAHVAREKVWTVYFKADKSPFDLTPLLDMDVKIMPHLLAYFTKAWLGDTAYSNEEYRFCKLYHIVRNWNVAALFGYPSAESLRIGKRVVELEGKTSELEALVAKLRAENEKLKRENETAVAGKLKEDSLGSKQDEKKRGKKAAPADGVASRPRRAKKRRVS